MAEPTDTGPARTEDADHESAAELIVKLATEWAEMEEFDVSHDEAFLAAGSALLAAMRRRFVVMRLDAQSLRAQLYQAENQESQWVERERILVEAFDPTGTGKPLNEFLLRELARRGWTPPAESTEVTFDDLSKTGMTLDEARAAVATMRPADSDPGTGS